MPLLQPSRTNYMLSPEILVLYELTVDSPKVPMHYTRNSHVQSRIGYSYVNDTNSMKMKRMHQHSCRNEGKHSKKDKRNG